MSSDALTMMMGLGNFLASCFGGIHDQDFWCLGVPFKPLPSSWSRKYEPSSSPTSRVRRGEMSLRILKLDLDSILGGQLPREARENGTGEKEIRYHIAYPRIRMDPSNSTAI
jgi:hypothetical protein